MSDDLPSAWRLQSALLRSGFVPRMLRLAEVGDLRDEPADVVVFDRGVPGVAAFAVLERVRPPEGVEAPPVLFLSERVPVAAGPPGERVLPVDAAEDEVRAAVEELVAALPQPPPRVMPPIDEIDVAETLGETLTPLRRRRRRSRRSHFGPPVALAALIGVIAAYSALQTVGFPALVADALSSPTAAAPAGAAIDSEGAPPAAPTSSPAPILEQVVRTIEPTPVATTLPIVATASASPTLSPSPTAAQVAAASAPDVQSPSPTARASGAPIAQPVVTGVEGRVTDHVTGAALPGAVVSYHGPVVGQTTTSGDGRYRVVGLTPGAYEVVAAAPGYRSARNRAGVVADVVTSDNLALQPLGPAVIAPFLTVIDQRTGRPAAAYGYQVSPGDTLRSVAERAGTTVEEVLGLNRLDDPDHLTPGEVLYLPASTFGHK